MPDEVQDANAVSSPAPDAPAPSAEQAPVGEQVSEQTPPPTSQPAPAQFNMPPAERWEELRQQKVAAEQRAQQAEAMARMALERVQTPQVTVEDPWAGLVNHPDPQTALFYQQQQRLFQYEASRKADEKVRPILEIADAFRKELATIKVERFQDKNQELKPGSEDYNRVAELVGQGFDLETATEKVMYKRLKEENQALKAKQASVGSKVAANQTGPTQGMPATAGLPGQPGDWRNNVRNAFRKGGGLAEIVNAAGASRAP